MSSLPSVALLAWRQRLLVLRGIAVVIFALLFATAWAHSLSPMPALTVLFWLTLLWLPSALYWPTRHFESNSQQHLLTLEIGADILLFLGLLHQLGGSGNPVTFYLLIPVLIGSLSLPLLRLAPIILLAVIGYGLSLRGHPMPEHHHLHDLHDMSMTHGIGMWLVFSAMAAVLGGLGQALQKAAQQQQQQQATKLTLALQRERMYEIAADLADRAHELNTPLTTLMLLTDDLEPGQNEAQQQALQQIKKLANRMSDTLKRNNSETPQQRTPLSQLLAEQQRSLRALAPTLKIHWHGPDDPMLVTAAWQRILANLGYNACDAGATQMVARCQRDNQHWLIQISDDGPRHNNLHDDSSGDRSGMGIGLVLVETTLASLGGNLELTFNTRWTQARMTIPVSGSNAP
ncbi:MAG: sensor histidine kinase [Gammaproteobacteria bacterium HGW-Gammaproteobacteria-14]|nr:MAG: sensor histidine kinase [Gammaproteobacteria bacterium HGW-Gammaproteobacteria-14]